MKANSKAVPDSPLLSELRTMEQLQRELKHVFPSAGSLEWELRANRRAYVRAGALFEIAGRLMAHPTTFAKTALSIGKAKIGSRRHVAHAMAGKYGE